MSTTTLAILGLVVACMGIYIVSAGAGADAAQASGRAHATAQTVQARATSQAVNTIAQATSAESRRRVHATATTQAAFVATANVVSAQTIGMTQVVVAAAQATSYTAAVQAEATEATAQTPLAQFAFADTAQLDNWTISLAKLEARHSVKFAPSASGLNATGRWWVIWLDAKNNGNQSASLGHDFALELTDDHGASYQDIAVTNAADSEAFDSIENRDQIFASTESGVLTHPILAFDMPSTAIPVTLAIRHASGPAQRSKFTPTSISRVPTPLGVVVPSGTTWAIVAPSTIHRVTK